MESLHVVLHYHTTQNAKHMCSFVIDSTGAVPSLEDRTAIGLFLQTRKLDPCILVDEIFVTDNYYQTRSTYLPTAARLNRFVAALKLAQRARITRQRVPGPARFDFENQPVAIAEKISIRVHVPVERPTIYSRRELGRGADQNLLYHAYNPQVPRRWTMAWTLHVMRICIALNIFPLALTINGTDVGLLQPKPRELAFLEGEPESTAEKAGFNDILRGGQYYIDLNYYGHGIDIRHMEVIVRSIHRREKSVRDAPHALTVLPVQRAQMLRHWKEKYDRYARGNPTDVDESEGEGEDEDEDEDEDDDVPVIATENTQGIPAGDSGRVITTEDTQGHDELTLFVAEALADACTIL